MSVIPGIAVAGAGFLLAVLWFDLMFDVQALRQPPGDLPEPVLASTAAYYARVTTGARPMNRLIALAMLVTLAAVIGELVRHCVPAWVAWASLAIGGSAVGLAGARTVRNGVRLGARGDAASAQSALARSILRDHVFCFVCILTVLALQIGWGR
ncbi:MAG TPA: hypothetical protein VFA83_23620 [Acidimicrobiales bacterium]|nr:hypothetical protein [Acidimicrobiales bacterium]